ncbi:RHS repeat domain-containing protein [Blastopirellula retiformator]|uniref:tRNA(Glu)-specific nuclease WapA n=1 Tax=Blastopirellula retiformator TaxID=2527970 RepID=A0A5C5V2W8_9BACT|nr:RHS repeat-associated core domain-containing protein [Blastopirellula retiformator]TWT32082.1 tRNA(Glu)-specific nuclease WapA precursor [Blastopirellula retiformator]
MRADGKRIGVTETYWLDENQDGTPEAHTVDIDWTYDALGRLTQETIDHFHNQFDQTETFEYDLVGNRTKKELDSDFDGNVDEAIAYLYDANDRLQTEERDVNNDSTVDVTTTYAYDHTQQTSKTVFDNSASQNTSQTSFEYDLQGRLYTATVTTYTSGTASRIEKTTYDYDATGIRVSAKHQVDTDANGTWDETTDTEYLVDHQNPTGYQQVIKETIYDDQGNVVKVIEYNFGHDEISQTVTEYNTAGQVTAQHTEIFGHDGHGSVKVLYDAAAAIAQVYTYEAYGQMLAIHNAIAGVVGTTEATALTTLLYSGEQFDSRIGQQYLRARYYDPNSGRFNRLDPFAGNSQDPQSFHKYLYTHGNPVMGLDPTGVFDVISMLASVDISVSTDSKDASASVNAISTAHRFKRTMQIYQKALKIFNKVRDTAQDIADIIDLLSFDPSDIKGITNSLAAVGISKAITYLPDKVISRKITLPKKVLKKFNKTASRFYGWGMFHSKVSEIIGELGLGLILYALDFEMAPLTIHAVHGPDQVARQRSTGLWGIFEAKGGKAGLGGAKYGRQMMGDWITHWMKRMIDQNQGTSFGESLEDAYDDKSPMLAAIARLNLRDPNTQLHFAAQKYEPPTGSNMKWWGDEWNKPY